MTGSPSVAKRRIRLGSVVSVAAIAVFAANGALAQSPSAPALDGTGVTITLITKDNTNPFFVKMHEGAQAEAAKLGATLDYAAGTSSADVDTPDRGHRGRGVQGIERHPPHRQR